MKITINLSDAEVKGIKKYLLDTGNDTAKKEDIAAYLNNELSGIFQSPHCAVSDYISEAQQ